MAKIRHESRSFNFKPPGTVFEVPDEDVKYLVETYGCEVVGEDRKAPEVLPESVVTTPEPGPVTVTTTDEAKADPDPVKPDPPEKLNGGWWLWNGEKYRTNKLPAEAKALLE